MTRRTLALVAGVLLFWALFAWQRARSPLLRIEAEAAAARALAGDAGLPVAEVMALRYVLGVDAAPAAWQDAGHRYAQLRPSHGGALAAAAVCGHERTVDEALRAARGDSELAFRRLWEARDDAGLTAQRFSSAYERLSARAAAR